MSLTTSQNRISYTGDGTTIIFPFPYLFQNNADIQVWINNVQIETGFVTTGASNASLPTVGGQVTFTTAPAAGQAITLIRVPSTEQNTVLATNDAFPAKTIETMVDAAMLAIQRLYDILGLESTQNQLQIPLSYPLADGSISGTLPAAVARAQGLLGFDPNGLPIAVPLPASVGAGNMTAELGSNGHPGFKNGPDFTGGITTALALSKAYGTVANVLVAWDGLYVEKDSYTLNGNQIIFGSWSGGTFTPSAIPASVQNVDVVGGTTLSSFMPGVGTVGSAALAAGAVTAPAIAAGAVTASVLAAGAVSAKLATEAPNQLTTGEYYANLGARINRFNDRILLGGATIGDGNQSPTKRDWLDALITPSTSTAQLGVLSTVGETAVLGGTRSSDALSSGTEACIGVVGICVNNATGATQQVGFGGYFEVDQSPNAGFSAAIEVDSANQSGVVVPITPYSLFPSGNQPCVNAWFAAGGARSGVSNSSAGLVFLENGASFDKGIVFQAGCVASNEAIVLAQSQVMQWWASASVPSGFIGSTASASNYGITITDAGIFLGNSPASSQNATASLEVVNVNSAVNYVGVTGGIAGVSPTISAFGSDTNINLSLAPKGSGLLGFGGATASSATSGGGSALPATPAGYLEFILNSNGITYKIPYYNV